jgi:hypothetical protein
MPNRLETRCRTQADASARDAEQAWRKAKQLEQALIELLQQALPPAGCAPWASR